MAKVMITYLGGDQPNTPEEGQEHFAKYKKWLASLGAAIVSPANLLKATHTITPDGCVAAGGNTGMSGYTIIEAQSIEAALEMAKGCLFLDINGTLEISELIKMNM